MDSGIDFFKYPYKTLEFSETPEKNTHKISFEEDQKVKLAQIELIQIIAEKPENIYLQITSNYPNGTTEQTPIYLHHYKSKMSYVKDKFVLDTSEMKEFNVSTIFHRSISVISVDNSKFELSMILKIGLPPKYV